MGARGSAMNFVGGSKESRDSSGDLERGAHPLELGRLLPLKPGPDFFKALHGGLRMIIG